MHMKSVSGFSYLEAMVLIVVLGVVSAITIPKFQLMLHQSREGRTKSNLGDMRGALAIYYSDNFGLYPSDAGTPETRLIQSLTPHYIKKIPSVELTHIHSNQLNTINDRVDDSGNWIYTTFKGFIAVNCTHLDTRGEAISSW